MFSKVDRWILTKLSLKIENTAGTKHKRSYLSDLVFLIVYTAISLYNALALMFSQLILTDGKGTSPSLLVIYLNVIVIVRLNIDIYIKKKENVNVTLDRLPAVKFVQEIDIKTWRYRLEILCVGYGIILMVIVYYFCYGEVVSGSLAIAGIVAVIETFINSFLDNLAARYEADPEVFMKE